MDVPPSRLTWLSEPEATQGRVIRPHTRDNPVAAMLAKVRQALGQPVPAAIVLFAIILTATGAFGTFRIILPLRLGYWLLVACSAGAGLYAARRLFGAVIKRDWARHAACVVAAAVPTALVAVIAAAALTDRAVSLRRLLELYPTALVLNLLLLVLWRLTATREVVVEGRPPPARDDSVPPLIASKLPPKLARSRLLAVEAQDHYLRVMTRDGEALVYMRFADALGALSQSDGTRTHRSWWVARTSIESTRFADGRGELTLLGGAVVPVSRSFAPAVRQLARQPKA